MLETTGYTWIVPELAMLESLQEGLDVLNGISALKSEDVRILTVSPGKPVFVPAGMVLPNGDAFPAGVLTTQNLPAQGLVLHGGSA